MYPKEILLDLFRHMNWADATVWNSVLSSPQTYTDERLKNLFFHLHLVQYGFYNLWGKQHFVIPTQSDFNDIMVLNSWGRKYHENVKPFLQNTGNEDLGRSLLIPWANRIISDPEKYRSSITLSEAMLQVVMHSQYHRAQINTRLRELGGEPPIVDFIMWLLSGKPDAEWKSENKNIEIRTQNTE